MFEELNFGDKFVLRFNKNEDGTYGRMWTLDELKEMQGMLDEAFLTKKDQDFIARMEPTESDYLAAMGPCGK